MALATHKILAIDVLFLGKIMYTTIKKSTTRNYQQQYTHDNNFTHRVFQNKGTTEYISLSE